jgi:hypothetical protein
MPLAYTDFSDFLLQAGGVVGGSSVLLGTIGVVFGTGRREMGRSFDWAYQRQWEETDPLEVGQYAAVFGGIVGIGSVLAQAIIGS